MAKAAHHRGSHQVRAKRVAAAAYANPDTRCAKCGRTLDQHPRTKTGRPPTWSAGHVIAGQIDGALRPEVLSCNSRDGQRIKTMRAKSATRTELTW